MSANDIWAGIVGGGNRALEAYMTTADKKKERDLQLGLLKAEKGLTQKVDENGNVIDNEFVETPEHAQKVLKERRMNALDQGHIVDYDTNDYKYAPGKIEGEAAIKKAMRDPLDDEYKRALITKANKEATSAKLTPGQESADKTFGKEYIDWTSSGRATTEKNLDRLEKAKEQLKNNSDLTGRITGRLPDFLRSQDSLTTQQDVQAAAQGALKATLGAQFTEKEGERIMNMAYDPKLSAEANIKKIDAAIKEIQQIKNTKDAQSSEFEKRGSISGGFLKPAEGMVPRGLIQPQEKKASVPKMGDVVDGFTFKGGDPSKPENWEASKKAGM